MFILIVGCGRVGSAVAKRALDAGHEVSVLDSDPLSHERLDKDQSTTWEDAGGRFTVGTALEIDGLIEAGIEEADVFLAATRGDNTNLVIAQIAQRRFNGSRGSWSASPIPAARRGTRSRACSRSAPTQQAIDQAAELALADRSAASHVRDHRRGRQGRLEPCPRADRQGPRGNADRVRPPPLPGRRGGARARGRSTATPPSCGCSSAPGSSGPTS